MPLYLSRRGFLRSAAAASAAVVSFRPVAATEREVDPDLFAVLNDSHVSENTAAAPNGQNISANLRHVVEYLVDLPRRPAAVFINGDLAHNKGLPGDYRQLAKLIRPLTEAGIELHLTMGNHDDRETFFEILGEQPGAQTAASKHVAVVHGRRANFFLLDSLTKTNVVTGELGDEQRAWLLKALDEHADRPAILVVHHNPQFAPAGPEAKFTWGGLRDATELFAALVERRHVKAYVHGHIHSWGLGRRDDLHVINTPAVGYVAKDGDNTTGWTMCRLRDDGATLTTYTVNGNHPWHDKSHDLTWRL